MKTLIPITALAALVASSFSFAQTPAFSKPSGYTTQVLKPNTLNFVGINVLTPTVASGSITAIQDTNLGLVDNKAAFTTSLQAGKMHTIEITSGAAVGYVREFVTFTNNKVTISAAISGLALGDKYIIRKNLTLQEMFPQGAPLTGAPSLPATADVVRVPDGAGNFLLYWYKTNNTDGLQIGWWRTPDGAGRGQKVTTDIPLLYTDGIEINRKAGVNKNLVLTGQVKTTSSRIYVVTGTNPVSINSPVSSNLDNSGLSSVLQGHATSPATADILWVRNPANSAFNRYWRKTSNTGGTAGWYQTPDGVAVGQRVSNIAFVQMSPHIRIQRKGAARFMQIKAPLFYSNL